MNGETIIPMIMNINKHCITFMNINGGSWELAINNQHTLGLAQPREVLLSQLQFRSRRSSQYLFIFIYICICWKRKMDLKVTYNKVIIVNFSFNYPNGNPSEKQK